MLSLYEVLFVFCIIIAVLLLVRNQQTKELANDIAKRFCKQNRLQFLDGTVAMTGIHFSKEFPALIRQFRFEYSTDKVDRYPGHISIIGRKTQSIYVDPSHLPPKESQDILH